MTTRCMTSMFGRVVMPPRRRFAPTRVLKIAASLAVTIALMTAETWVIEQSPLWSTACILTPVTTSSASNDETEPDGPLRDTAGPVAVLH
jgi:hypothetical protein